MQQHGKSLSVRFKESLNLDKNADFVSALAVSTSSESVDGDEIEDAAEIPDVNERLGKIGIYLVVCTNIGLVP